MGNLHLASIGSVYLETNYIGLETAGRDHLEIGKEYRAASYAVGLGGSAVNFAVQAKALGLDISLIGKVGDDEQGKKIISFLSDAQISSNLIHVSREVQTSVDTGIVLAHSGQNIQLVSGNANQSLSLSDIPLSHPDFSDISSVYLGGYFKQESLYLAYPELLQKISGLGKKIYLDHGRAPVDVAPDKLEILKSSLPFVEGYFLNDTELFAITGTTVMSDAIAQVRSFGAKFVVIKQGEKGCMVVTQNISNQIATTSVVATNTVGAGDAFNAGFLSKYIAGADIYSAAMYGNMVATYKVAHNVVVLPDMLDN